MRHFALYMSSTLYSTYMSCLQWILFYVPALQFLLGLLGSQGMHYC